MHITETADFHVFACIKWGHGRKLGWRGLRHFKTEIN